MEKYMQSNKKNILLISLGYNDGSNLEEETCFVQLGILYLATVLKNNGYSPDVIFSDYPDVSSIIERIKKENICLTGFYTTTENIYRSIKCGKILKEAFPEMKIILGGPHATVMDEKILEKEETVDLIVRHEGEEAIIELAKFYISNEGSLKDIKGLTYREDSKIIKNSDRPFIKELDKLPIPDRDLLEEPIKSFAKIFPRIITGRGCPFQCAFCAQGMAGNKYRMRSAENVLKEVDYLLSRGPVRYIRFLDDTFIVNPGRTRKICRGLREKSEEGKNFMWFAEGRVDVLSKHPRIIYEMSLAGLANIQIGVECAHQSTLDLYKKNIKLEEVEKVVRICADALIPSISINFILGGPFETDEIYKKNMDFIKKLIKIAPGRVNITSSLLVPFPGTMIKKEPEKFGLRIIDSDCITGMTNETCFCETEELDKYELTNIKRNFLRDVRKIMIEASKDVPFHIVSQNFSMKFYGIITPWHLLFLDDIGVKRYFNLKLHSGYFSIDEVPEKILPDFYATRTYPLNYNEEKLVTLEKIYGTEVLHSVTGKLYELSSGKRKVKNIVKIMQKEFFKDMTLEETHKEIIKHYRALEKLQAIIFSKV